MQFRLLALLILCAAWGCGDLNYDESESRSRFAGDEQAGPGGSDDLSGDDLHAGNSGEPPDGEYDDEWDDDWEDGRGDDDGDGGGNLGDPDPAPTCGDVLDQSAYCLTMEMFNGDLHWVGLDDGALCHAGRLPADARQDPGQSVMVVGDVAYVCGSDEDGAPRLFEYDLATHEYEDLDVSCGALVPDPRGGFLATPQLGDETGVEGVSRYDSLRAFLDGEPAGSMEGGYGFHSMLAAYGDSLYAAWHSTREVEEYDLTTGSLRRTIVLDRPDDWIFGMTALRGRLVVTAPGRVASLSVFDVETGEALAIYDHGLDFGGVHCFERDR